MRNNIVKPLKTKISYEIREIISKVDKISELGFPIIKENIGDPILKGHILPTWMKEIIKEATGLDSVYAYCESKGLIQTRNFLARRTNTHGGTQINADDITFFNGLGDAIARVYSLLHEDVRVIMPTPTYPAHSSAEISRIGTKPLTYHLDPLNNWRPDLQQLETTISNNPAISAVLIINPDNPTGKVHLKEDLTAIVQIAKKYGLFIICDEIYEDLVYSGQMVRLAEVIEDVPAICMKGISKVLPWPGSRCGWIEYYNRKVDPEFEKFCSLIDQHKMTEVCSTTLPQYVIPQIMQHPKFNEYLNNKKKLFMDRMSKVKHALVDIDGIRVTNVGGAFYATLTFENSFWKNDFPLDPLDHDRSVLLKEWLLETDRLDLKFVYYLIATEGICMVPLTGFNSQINGLRFTLLENDTNTFNTILEGLRRACKQISISSEFAN